MPDIVLATANARYSHSSLALRYLKANLGPLEEQARILELTIDDQAAAAAEKILEQDPRIVGLGVYLWNTELLFAVARILRQVRPDLKIVLGGPEISYEIDEQPIAALADHIITGPGELVFRDLCEELSRNVAPPTKVLPGRDVDLGAVALPYHLYDDEDIRNKVIYVEASRGCPFGCEFCLSSRDAKVHRFDGERILGALQGLWDRGARRFKFTDRALHLAVTPRLLRFFLDRNGPAFFCHFELIPDHLPEELLPLLARFPKGAVQLEAGVQTFNPEVASRIGRKQDAQKVERNLRSLLEETGVHLHTDLVVGLPGESLADFARSFDRLICIGPQEIQVGILKRLRGAPIARHDGEWQMRYNPAPPYEILQNRSIDFFTMQRLKRFSRYFDMVHNSGNFASFAPLIWSGGSPFWSFLELADWLYEKTGRTNAIALNRLCSLLFEHAVHVRGAGRSAVANRLSEDYRRLGRKGLPGDVQKHVTIGSTDPSEHRPDIPPRQLRHLK